MMIGAVATRSSLVERHEVQVMLHEELIEGVLLVGLSDR